MAPDHGQKKEERPLETLNTIPVELLASVFQYLDLPDLSRVSRTSRSLLAAVSSTGLRDYSKRQIGWFSLGCGLYTPFNLAKRKPDARFWWDFTRRCCTIERSFVEADERPPGIRTWHSSVPRRQTRGGAGSGSGCLPVVKLDRAGLLFLGLGDSVEVSRLKADGTVKARVVLQRPHGRVAPLGDITEICLDSGQDGKTRFWTGCFDGTIRRHALSSLCLKQEKMVSRDVLERRKRGQVVLPASLEVPLCFDVDLDAHDGKCVSSLDLRSRRDGSLLLSAGFDGTVKLWSVSESDAKVGLVGGQELSQCSKPKRPWTAKFLAMNSMDVIVGHTTTGLRGAIDSISLFSIDPTFGLVRSRGLDFHKGASYSISTLPCTIAGSGNQFISTGYDGTAAYWDLRTDSGKPALSFDDYDDYNLFSSTWDGAHRVVVGTGRHGVVRGWDLRNLKKPTSSVFAFRKDTPVYALETDFSRWFAGGEGEVAVVEF
jgi:WD40 repeat protein